MVTIKLFMRATHEPLKRTPIVLECDSDGRRSPELATDRNGEARFNIAPASGKVLVSGIERHHGYLAGDIEIGLSTITEPGDDSAGNPGEFPEGSNAYTGITTRTLEVGGATLTTDSEGYLVNPSDWSEQFARTQAANEGLTLTDRHWELIRYLREHYRDRGTQAAHRRAATAASDRPCPRTTRLGGYSRADA